MSPRSLLGILAGLLLITGLVLGLSSPKEGGTTCGSVFTGISDEAKSADYVDELGGTLEGATPDADTTNIQDACTDKLDDRRLPAYGAIGLAVVALIVSFVASGETGNRRSVDDDPTFRQL